VVHYRAPLFALAAAFAGCQLLVPFDDPVDEGVPDLVSCTAPAVTVCNNVCVDLTKDDRNCGACGKSCGLGFACVGSACTVACQPGLSDCSGACVNLMTDNAHCGGCMTACPMGNVCTGGMCTLSCQMGLDNCGGTCVNLMSDNAHCGDCMTACTAPLTCVSSACTLVCAAPTVVCGTMCVDTRFDPDNCSMCGKVCATVPHGTRGCSMGKCGIASCSAGYRDCDGMAGNGCEVNVNTDPSNCGGCGTMCSGAQICVGGMCMAPPDMAVADLAVGGG
jgi:hypothetical protein